MPDDSGSPDVRAAARRLLDEGFVGMPLKKRQVLGNRLRGLGLEVVASAKIYKLEVAGALRELRPGLGVKEAEWIACWAVLERWPPLTKEEVLVRSQRGIQEGKRRRAAERDRIVEPMDDTPEDFPESGDSVDVAGPADAVAVTANLVRVIAWVFEHIEDTRVTRKQAPSAGAWSYLQHVKRNERNRERFYNGAVLKVLGGRGRGGDEGEVGDGAGEGVVKDVGLDEVSRLLGEVSR